MISMTYDLLAKRLVSLSEMNRFAFADFSASPRRETKRREIGRGFGFLPGSPTRKGGS
jgi:hypothetical protein